MVLTSRGVAHILANRARIREGRSETVVVVTEGVGTVGHQAVSGVAVHVSGAIRPGVSNRIGEITRVPWDAVMEFPGTTDPAVFTNINLIARTATASLAGVAAALERYFPLDIRREGLGTRGDGGGLNQGDRWVIKCRLQR